MQHLLCYTCTCTPVIHNVYVLTDFVWCRPTVEGACGTTTIAGGSGERNEICNGAHDMDYAGMAWLHLCCSG
jgi:hypothetical protein